MAIIALVSFRRLVKGVSAQKVNGQPYLPKTSATLFWPALAHLVMDEERLDQLVLNANTGFKEFMDA